MCFVLTEKPLHQKPSMYNYVKNKDSKTWREVACCDSRRNFGIDAWTRGIEVHMKGKESKS